MAALERQAEGARREGRLPPVKMLRDFEPSERVAARLEVSTGRLFRGRTAGVDVMGDGSLVPFRGGVGRDELKPRGRETPFDAVRRALAT